MWPDGTIFHYHITELKTKNHENDKNNSIDSPCRYFAHFYVLQKELHLHLHYCVGTSSADETHSIDNATYTDAKNSCNNYQDQANNTLPGGTTCHL